MLVYGDDFHQVAAVVVDGAAQASKPCAGSAGVGVGLESGGEIHTQWLQPWDVKPKSSAEIVAEADPDVDDPERTTSGLVPDAGAPWKPRITDHVHEVPAVKLAWYTPGFTSSLVRKSPSPNGWPGCTTGCVKGPGCCENGTQLRIAVMLSSGATCMYWGPVLWVLTPTTANVESKRHHVQPLPPSDRHKPGGICSLVSGDPTWWNPSP